jgi:hypothetical protein
MRASERYLSARGSIARGGGEIVIDANLLQRMRLEEFSVRVAEVQTLSSEPLEFAARDEDRNWLPAARQLNLDARFGLIDDSWESGSGFGDGIPLRHSLLYI